MVLLSRADRQFCSGVYSRPERAHGMDHVRRLGDLAQHRVDIVLVVRDVAQECELGRYGSRHVVMKLSALGNPGIVLNILKHCVVNLADQRP